MNYLPFVSWGMYGGTSAKQRANFFASWGLMENLTSSTSSFAAILYYYYRVLMA